MVAYDSDGVPMPRMTVGRNVENEPVDPKAPEDPRYAPIVHVTREAGRLSESFGKEIYQIESEFKKRLANIMEIAGPPNPQALYEEIDRYRVALDNSMDSYAVSYSKLFEVTSTTEREKF